MKKLSILIIFVFLSSLVYAQNCTSMARLQGTTPIDAVLRPYCDLLSIEYALCNDGCPLPSTGNNIKYKLHFFRDVYELVDPGPFIFESNPPNSQLSIYSFESAQPIDDCIITTVKFRFIGNDIGVGGLQNHIDLQSIDLVTGNLELNEYSRNFNPYGNVAEDGESILDLVSPLTPGGENRLVPFNGDCSVFNVPLVLKGDFSMDTDYCFRNAGSATPRYSLTTISNSLITIEEGVEITMKNVDIDNCQGTAWRGILMKPNSKLILDNCHIVGGLETIKLEEGASLEVLNSSIANSESSAIFAESGSFLFLDGLVISDSNNGIVAEGQVQFDRFENCQFLSIDSVGVKVENSFIATMTAPGINLVSSLGKENIFDDMRTAIYAENSSVGIKYNKITNCIFGLDFKNVSSSDIQKNTIDDTNLAINAKESVFRVLDNEIGGNNNVISAFNLRKCSNVLIKNNNIYSINDGLRSTGSSVELFENNFFSLSLTANDWTRSVTSLVSNDQISSNYFDSGKSSSVIENVLSPGSEISNNHFDVFLNNKTAITLRSTTDVDVLRNDISNQNNGLLFSSGIFVRNSSENLIECNQIETSWNGIDIKDNSNRQSILTNHLNASNYAIELNSTIGAQYFNGNSFVDGNAIVALGDAALNPELSLFTVDPSIDDHMPDFWDPSELLIPAFDSENLTRFCVAPIGPLLVPEIFDPTLLEIDQANICSIIDNLESVKVNDYKKYFINIQHLYRYFLLKEDISDWPECLSLKWFEDVDCGIKHLTISEIEIFNQLNNKNQELNLLNEKITQRRNLQDTGEGTNAELLNEISTINESVVGDFSSELDISRNLIGNLNCTEEITQIWREAILILIDYVDFGEITVSQSESLTEIAQKCPHDYGDPVEWSQLILNQSEQLAFENSENCLGEKPLALLPSNKEVLSGVSVSLSPNPTDNILKLDFTEKISNLSYSIYSIDGKLKLKSFRDNLITTTIDVSTFENGVYFIRLNMDGLIVTKKIIKS